MYRPQFAFSSPPPGFRWQPCVYQWDSNTIPALGNLTLSTGQESSYIPLRFDADEPFFIHAIKIQNGGVNVALWDPDGNPLMDDYVKPCQYASELQPATVLEGLGIEVCPRAVFQVRLQGQ